MHYKSIQIFQIKGLSPLEEGDVFSLTDGCAIDMSATFCVNIDEYCSEIDRKNVIGNLMLGGPWGLENETQIAVINKQIEELRSERQKQTRKFATVALEVLIDIEDREFKYIRKLDGFIVSLDEIPIAELDKFRLASSHAKNLLLSSLLLSAKDQIEIHKITEGSYLIDSENNCIYNYSPSVSGRAYILQKVNEQSVLETKIYLKILKKSPEFSKVCRLLSQAIDEKNDNLRSFIFAWIALEIFINKVFKEY